MKKNVNKTELDNAVITPTTNEKKENEKENITKTKFCPYCETNKNLEEWSKRKYTPYCRKCWALYAKRYRATHKELITQTNKRHWQKFKVRYSIDRKCGGRSLYEKLYEEQKGLCAICHNPETSKRYKTLTVDHCHKTEQIRGLLCSNCNRALGFLRENVKVLKSAIKYIQKYEPNKK